MIKVSDSLDDVRVPAGFVFASTTAGIKQSGKPDLAIAFSPRSSVTAALFTTSRVVAAPVTVGREHLKRSGGRVQCVIVNSGNANCATGTSGERASRAICLKIARTLRCDAIQVIPSSTGIIGVPLPTEKILAAIDNIETLEAGATDFQGFARAIMTTDTRPKVASAQIKVGREIVRIAGAAKGAGMIHPNMATMLVYLFTDVAARRGPLQKMFKEVADQTLNSISIDGDTSTNDTALLLASGASGIRLSKIEKQFRGALLRVCASLARQIVNDGEGVEHVVTLNISGAATDEDARRAARAIANSPLVKTAWTGSDPNWGRMLAAIGSSGIRVEPDQVSIAIGPYQVCRRGAVARFDAAEAHAFMRQREYEITISLGRGRGRCCFVTCDLSEEYVRINSEYST